MPDGKPDNEVPQILTIDQMRQLTADLNPNRVAERKQGTAKLSYLQAWDVRASLIRIFGFGGWSAELLECDILRMAQDVPALNYTKDRDAPKTQKMDPLTKQPMFNWNVTAKSIVKLTIHQLGAVYTEAAVASQTGPDVGEVTDFAVKTSESDAFKRAAMNLGTQFGLSLYDSGSTADVVRVLLSPDQRPTLKFLREGGAAPNKEAPKVAPAEVEVTTGYVDGEGDYHEPTPKKLAEAKGSVQHAFGS